jgi:hypothetical protein
MRAGKRNAGPHSSEGFQIDALVRGEELVALVHRAHQKIEAGDGLVRCE